MQVGIRIGDDAGKFHMVAAHLRGNTTPEVFCRNRPAQHRWWRCRTVFGLTGRREQKNKTHNTVNRYFFIGLFLSVGLRH